MVYASTSLFLPLILPSIALGLGLMISALAEGGQLRRQRSAVRKVFSQYVPKQVVDQLIDKPSQSLLAGHRATITCLFTDIAGFTSLAEKMDPVQLVELMNRYFDGVTRIIHKHEGTVDKFIGDAVLAFFGAPLEQPDHANRAVAAGIEIHQFSTDLREHLTKEGIDLGETRIGIHTGEAVVGNIGGELRQNYTALGDAVNLASRLEGANRYLGSSVCISETTMGMASDHPTRPLGNIVVKGRSETIGVYEPLAVVNRSEEFVKQYHEAYQALDTPSGLNRALELFQDMLRQAPDDRVIKMHIRRLEAGQNSTNLILESK
jgi:class 3 adenylate cyclase